MERLDLKKEWAPLYTARKKPDLIEVPSHHAITIKETLPPGAETIAPSSRNRWMVAYTLKFATKAEGALDYPVLPPEAVFRVADFAKGEGWRWTAAVAVPDAIDAGALRRAVKAVRGKHPETPWTA